MSDRPETLTQKEWVTGLRDGRLLGQRCSACDNETATPFAACPACGERALETIELPTTGTIYSETMIAVAPTAFEADYQIAIIDLDTPGNARITARIADDVDIGETVELVDVLEVTDPVPVFG